jgi:outer membrane protein assembly factor BamB
MTADYVYVGMNGHVTAIHKKAGLQAWRTRLRGSGFVTLLVDGDLILAHNCGFLFALDTVTGRELWQNDLPGLGYGLGMLAVDGASSQQTLAGAVEAAKMNTAQQAIASQDG